MDGKNKPFIATRSDEAGCHRNTANWGEWGHWGKFIRNSSTTHKRLLTVLNGKNYDTDSDLTWAIPLINRTPP